MKKHKVLIIAKNIDGGTGTYIKSLSKIQGDKYSTSILSIETPIYRKHEKNILTLRSPIEMKQNKLLPISFLHVIKDFAWIKNNLKEISPTTVIGVGNYSNILISFATMRMNVNTILTIHNNIQSTLEKKSSKLSTFFLKKIMKHVYSHANHVVCVSKGVAQNLKKISNLKHLPLVIYNGVTPKMGERKMSLEKIILNICRFDDQKDHLTLLTAFKAVRNKIPQAKLWLVGDGPTKQSIKKYVDKSNIKNVSFYGWREDVKRFFKETTLFVHSSHRDGLPYTILEAISHGIPTISTDSKYGPSEILGKGKYGILTPPRDSIKLSQSILLLLNSSKKIKHFSNQAKIRSEFFSEEMMINSYKEIIQ